MTPVTPQREAGRKARQLTSEQIEKIVAGRMLGQSIRDIAAGEKIGRGQVERVLRDPAVVARIESEQANAAAVEVEKTEAVARERKHEQSKKSSAAHRAKEAGFEPNTPPAERRAKPGPNSADGRILGAYGSPRRIIPGIPDDDGFVVKAGTPSGSMSREEWFDAEREVDPATIRCAAITHIGQYGYLKTDEAELRAAAHNVEQDRPDLTYNDILATLTNQAEGARFAFPRATTPLEDLPLAEARA